MPLPKLEYSLYRLTLSNGDSESFLISFSNKVVVVVHNDINFFDKRLNAFKNNELRSLRTLEEYLVPHDEVTDMELLLTSEDTEEIRNHIQMELLLILNKR